MSNSSVRPLLLSIISLLLLIPFSRSQSQNSVVSPHTIPVSISPYQNHTYDILNDGSARYMDKIASKYSYYRFTENHYSQHFVATRNETKQLLFVPPFTQFFSFRQLTAKFDFLKVKFNEDEVQRLFSDYDLKDVSFRDLRSSPEYTEVMSWILIEMMNTTAFSQYNYLMCHENVYSWFELAWNAPNRQHVVSKTYFCCDREANCGWQIQSLLFSTCHVIFVTFNVAFALVVMFHITKTRRIFFLRDEQEAKYVTNGYWNPPFWLSEFLPARDRWAGDIRNWTTISMISIMGGLLFLNLVHILVPVEFPETKYGGLALPIIEASQFFGSIRIGDYSLPGMFLWALLLLPAIFIANIITTIIKLRAPRFEFERYLPKRVQRLIVRQKRLRRLSAINNSDGQSSIPSSEPAGHQIVFKIANLEIRLAVANVFERFVRLFFSGFVSLVMTVAVFLLLLLSFELYEFNEVFILAQAFVVWLLGVIYLQQVRAIVAVSPRAIWSAVINIFYHDRNQVNEGSPLLGNLPGAFERLNDGVLDDSEHKSITHHISRFIVKHLLPTLLFEGLWFGTVMILSFIAGSIITRLIWSLLLLFIIYSDFAQVAVYFVTLGLTVGKYIVELQQPHNMLKQMIMEQKPSLTRSSMDRWNAYMMERHRQDPRQLDDAIIVDKELRYFVMISWKSFFEMADLCNVSYFINKSLLRALFSLFVITLFFMASVIFGSMVGDDFSQFLKIGAVVLMPLIPNILSLLESKNSLEEAIFKSRFRAAMSSFEFKNCPDQFKMPFTKGRYRVACTACTWKVMHKKPDLLEPQQQLENVTEMIDAVREELERTTQSGAV